MKLTGLLQLVNKLQQVGKIENLQQAVFYKLMQQAAASHTNAS